MSIDPLKYTIASLIAAGQFDAASKLARQAAKRSAAEPAPTGAGSAASPDAPTTLSQAWKAAEASGATLGLKHLRSISVEDMGELRHKHPDLLERSLQSLEA